MSNKQSRAVAGGCLGTVVGGVLGCLLGGAFGQFLGLKPNGGILFIALDLLFYFCVGGGGFIGAIIGREIATAIAKQAKVEGIDANTNPHRPDRPDSPEDGTEATADESAQ